MSLKAAVGLSHGEDSHAVGVNSCQDAVNELGCAPDMVLVFSSVYYDPEQVIAGVRSVAKTAVVVGSSTSGEITAAGPAKPRGVAVMAISSPGIKFYAGVGENIAASPRAAGKTVAEAVKSQAAGPLSVFMMFPDVLTGNGADILRGALESLGEHFPVVGGASGDDFQFKKTYQYLGDKVYSGAVVGVGLSGTVKLGVGVRHGWIPIGLPLTVTRSEGGVLHELDGRPALSLYEDYFGNELAGALKDEALAKLAITYPLGMKVSGSDEMLIRSPLFTDQSGSITCTADIPEGVKVQLMLGAREEAVKVAKEAAEKALSELGGTAKAVLVFDSVARSRLFGEHAGEEIAAVQEVIGKGVPLIGFYGYGELAPQDGEVRNMSRCNSVFHNETITVVVLGE